MPSTKFLPLLPVALVPFYATLLFKAAHHKAPLVRLTFEEEYDYIIVGGGSAGAVVASRLSEDPEVSVLLLEAGRLPNLFLDVPLLAAEIQQTKFDWAYLTVPQEAACFGLKNRQSRWPRGKVLGGSSVLNYMLYIRGNQRDYDRWEQQLGCEGWGWRSVLPYFVKSEDNRDPGIAHNGFAIPQSTLRRGARCSTAKAFLEPCRGRPNLHILVRAHVTKVLFDENRRARTVLFRYRRLQRAVRARQEIVLSSGSIGSAQLLMLSGVGPRLHLESLGIPVISDLPVGENLQDHIGGAGISFMINDSVSVVRKRFNPKTALDYFIKGQGPLTVPGGVEGISFIRTKYNAQNADWPDVEVHFVSSTPAADGGRTIRRVMGMTNELFDRVYRPYLNMDGFTMYPVLLRPKSRGWIRLRSTDPDDYPLINPRYLTRIEDVLVLVEGMKQLIALGYSEPFRKYDAQIFEPDFPGCEPYAPYSDEHLACIARTYTATIYHPSGTCRMGRPEMHTTVVDPQLRVKGVLGLRVVDASVFPEIPSANTNAPVIMVAEKASDMIRLSRRAAWGTNYLNWWLWARRR
ncbi:glucose dehydrogenase [FAD, quinone] isoform X2 [Rhipicephalus sanguineus]|uniref:glucose dehydrogenase [FAD, quinone] isoform X2 n=1 Tax=Rhipicephalus sanguineus TaxID=34632 RepID=UPI0020C56967|nr:glucose dehydrogenase [FAD, quinone] isoform X2 [Rhipicephalus sanguineus]